MEEEVQIQNVFELVDKINEKHGPATITVVANLKVNTEIVDKKTACKMLGDVNRYVIERWVKEGRLNVYKFNETNSSGAKWYFKVSEVKRFVEELEAEEINQL